MSHREGNYNNIITRDFTFRYCRAHLHLRWWSSNSGRTCQLYYTIISIIMTHQNLKKGLNSMHIVIPGTRWSQNVLDGKPILFWQFWFHENLKYLSNSYGDFLRCHPLLRNIFDKNAENTTEGCPSCSGPCSCRNACE